MAKGWSPEFEERIKTYFLSNRIGLQEMARKSGEIFGEEFSYELVKHYAERGKWTTLKSHDSSLGNTDINVEVDTIRKVLYRQIVSMSEGGLMVSGPPQVISDLKEELLDRGLIAEPVAPGGIESSLVNSYMNLLAKANFDLGKAASRKTSQQKALEILAKSRAK